MARNVIAFICWLLSPWAVLFVYVTHLPSAFAFPVALFFAYGLWRTLLAVGLLVAYVRIRRILRIYSWHLDRPPYGLSQHPESPHRQMWIEFPDPERPGELVPLHFLTHFREGWWQRRMAPRAKPEQKAQLDPIWFAGDPRFFGVIAVTTPGSDPGNPVPNRLHLLHQSRAHSPWRPSVKYVARATQAGGKRWGAP